MIIKPTSNHWIFFFVTYGLSVCDLFDIGKTISDPSGNIDNEAKGKADLLVKIWRDPMQNSSLIGLQMSQQEISEQSNLLLHIWCFLIMERLSCHALTSQINAGQQIQQQNLMWFISPLWRTLPSLPQKYWWIHVE